jgi:hypothetical protein
MRVVCSTRAPSLAAGGAEEDGLGVGRGAAGPPHTHGPVAPTWAGSGLEVPCQTLGPLSRRHGRRDNAFLPTGQAGVETGLPSASLALLLTESFST